MRTLNVKVLFNNESRLFECSKRDLLEKAAEHFNIDIREVELFSVSKQGERRQVTPHDITDLMVIEMVHKQSVATSTQRTLRSFSENESPVVKPTGAIITKLKNNTTLTGEERKKLVEWLETFHDTFPAKRKISEVNSDVAVKHKKVQVNFSAISCKDSFAQTDNTIDKVPTSKGSKGSKNTIHNEIKKYLSSGEEDKAEELMTKSFDERRHFIVFNDPPVRIIKDKYPMLFSLNETKNELRRLFYAEKCEEFINNIYKYAPLIVQKCSPDDDIYRKTKSSIDRAKESVQKEYARAVGSIFILTNLMEEEWRFVHLQDYPHGSDDVFPYIDASSYSLKELFLFDDQENKGSYRIVVENQTLCVATDFLEAVLCLVASFFIFNINYPESCSRTMIGFEKLYLNANDTDDVDDHTKQTVKLLQLEAKSGVQQ